MDVLVTGGAGFIGAHVCRALAERGTGRVVALDDLSTGLASNLAGLDVELVVGSVLERPLLAELVADCPAVVHLAAIPAVARSLADPLASHDVNVNGTMGVLEAVRRSGGHVIVASSSSVYGRGVTMPTSEDHATRPASPYAAGKLAAESYALAYARSFGLDVLAFRFFNVYGSYQRADHAYAAVIPAFLAAAHAGRPLPVHGDGTQTRDFTYAGDVSTVIADAVARRVTSEVPVNLAFGSNVSLLSLIGELESLMGRPLAREFAPTRPGDVHDSQADSARLRSLFPTLEPTALRDGLAATTEWYRLEGTDTAAAGADLEAVLPARTGP